MVEVLGCLVYLDTGQREQIFQVFDRVHLLIKPPGSSCVEFRFEHTKCEVWSQEPHDVHHQEESQGPGHTEEDMQDLQTFVWGQVCGLHADIRTISFSLDQ